MKQELLHPSLQTGDHIRVWRGTYYHHGIYCGDDVVIHYTGEVSNKINAKIKEDRLETFLDGGKIEIASYPKSLSSDVVIKNAKQRMGEQQYNLVFNNCEHFASWCKTGEPKSEQVTLAFHMLTELVMNPLVINLGERIFFHVTGYMKGQEDEAIKSAREHFPQNILLGYALCVTITTCSVYPYRTFPPSICFPVVGSI